jgi:hypothetical protein
MTKVEGTHTVSPGKSMQSAEAAGKQGSVIGVGQAKVREHEVYPARTVRLAFLDEKALESA